jgi:hypothetical protein
MMQSMARTLTADDILPLVASLTPRERVRLLRLIALPEGADAPAYRSVPPSRDEFSTDEEPLAWDAEGWEDVGCSVGRSAGIPFGFPISGARF